MKKIFFAAALAGAAMLASCGGNKGGVQLGSLSEFDSLSYSLGANIGYGMSDEMKDIPVDFKAVDKGVREGALGKATQEHDKSLDMLREYFMTKRGERAQAVEGGDISRFGARGRLFFCGAVGVGTLVGGRTMSACGVARLGGLSVSARTFVRRLLLARVA